MENKNKISRRDSLKVIGLGSLATSAFVFQGCDPKENTTEAHLHEANTDNEFKDLSEADKKLLDEKFFTDHEMKTIAVLSDFVIPADDRSGSATEAGVPDFIEFMMKDQPWHQTEMRGGLRWVDIQSLKQHDKNFVDCSQDQQTRLLDQIAYPETAKPEMSQGVAFFNKFRDFVATGFFTSKMGIEDMGYVGNKPANWQGVPDEVLAQYGVSYDEWNKMVGQA